MSERQRLRIRRDAIERSWAAFMSGEDAGAVRREVLSSWQRTTHQVTPEVTAAPTSTHHCDPGPLLASTHILDREFKATMQDSGLIVALADARGLIVWTTGEPALLRLGEQANFVAGALWDEASMGINAVSLALTSDGPSTVWSAEHWSSSLHAWSCYAAPIRHPETDQPLGVLNFSMPWDRGHPLASTAVVALAQRLAPEILANSGRSAVPDPNVLLLHVLGRHRASLAGTPLNLTRRQTEILVLLALRPDGISLEELHAELYGDAAVGIGTLKAEVSHLRRLLEGRISRAPYRLAGPVGVDALDLLTELQAGRVRDAVARYAGPLLAWSESPRLIRLGRTVEVALRDAVIAGTDHEVALALALKLEDDTELAEHALRVLPDGDARRHIMRAHLTSIA